MIRAAILVAWTGLACVGAAALAAELVLRLAGWVALDADPELVERRCDAYSDRVVGLDEYRKGAR